MADFVNVVLAGKITRYTANQEIPQSIRKVGHGFKEVKAGTVQRDGSDRNYVHSEGLS